MVHTERESWLLDIIGHIAPWYANINKPLPTVKVSCGFPSKGKRGKAIGECWSGECASDGLSQIFIHPGKCDAVEVCAILAHELIHAAVGCKAKHGKEFKAVADYIGLEGEMKSTHAGQEFIDAITPILEAVGPYPHAALSCISSTGKTQTTRLLKVICPGCGYTVRTTQKWIDQAGFPTCPCGTLMEASNV
jgi:hypothetical protein